MRQCLQALQGFDDLRYQGHGNLLHARWTVVPAGTASGSATAGGPGTVSRSQGVGVLRPGTMGPVSAFACGGSHVRSSRFLRFASDRNPG